MGKPLPETLDEAMGLSKIYWQWGKEPLSQDLLTMIVDEIEKLRYERDYLRARLNECNSLRY